MQATVRDIMTAPHITIAPTTTLDIAITIMIREEVSEVYVNDESGRLLGVVPDYELLKANLTKTPGSLRVEGLISRGLVTVAPESSVDEVTPVFREGRHSRVAVVEDGRLVGHISRRDILRYHQAVQRAEGRDEDLAASAEGAEHRNDGSKSVPPLRGPRYLKTAGATQATDAGW